MIKRTKNPWVNQKRIEHEANLKHLKKLAEKMPVMYTDPAQKTSILVSGYSLLMNGVEDLKTGDKVSPDKMYYQSFEGGVTVNHFKRMKKLLEQYGVPKVQEYINQVYSVTAGHNNLIQSMLQRAPQL